MVRLFWFAKADGSDAVSAVVQNEDPIFGTQRSNEIFLSDAALLARATAAGKVTWDETELCAALAEQLSADVHRAKSVEDAEAAATAAQAPPDELPPAA